MTTSPTLQAKLPPSAARGFTLVEMAIVLAIVGVLVTSMMFTLSAQIEQRSFNDTQSRLESAREAVLAYAIAVGLLYRFGPVRGPVPGRAVIPGAILATLLWLVASEGLSFYIAHMTSFGATYGSLGAVAGVMLWLYATAYAVLLGAELNAQIEAFRHGN